MIENNEFYCIYCDTLTELGNPQEFNINNSEVNGLIYHCPNCNAWVDTLPGSSIPKGTTANDNLRRLRKQLTKDIYSYMRDNNMTHMNCIKKISETLNINKNMCYNENYTEDQINKIYTNLLKREYYYER